MWILHFCSQKPLPQSRSGSPSHTPSRHPMVFSETNSRNCACDFASLASEIRQETGAQVCRRQLTPMTTLRSTTDLVCDRSLASVFGFASVFIRAPSAFGATNSHRHPHQLMRPPLRHKHRRLRRSSGGCSHSPMQHITRFHSDPAAAAFPDLTSDY